MTTYKETVLDALRGVVATISVPDTPTVYVVPDDYRVPDGGDWEVDDDGQLVIDYERVDVSDSNLPVILLSSARRQSEQVSIPADHTARHHWTVQMRVLIAPWSTDGAQEARSELLTRDWIEALRDVIFRNLELGGTVQPIGGFGRQIFNNVFAGIIVYRFGQANSEFFGLLAEFDVVQEHVQEIEP